MKLILITGSRRTGTNILGAILGAHPNCFLVNERDGVYDWLSVLLNLNDAVCDEQLEQKCRNEYINMIGRAVRKYRSPSDKFNARGKLNKDQVTHLVIQAPDLAWQWTRFNRQTMDANPTVIFMQRDLCATALSKKRIVGSYPWFISVALHWIDKNHRDFGFFSFLEETSILRNEDQPMILRMAALAKIKMNLATFWTEFGYRTTIVPYESLVRYPGMMIPCVVEKTCGLIEPEPGIIMDKSMYLTAYSDPFLCRRPLYTDSIDEWKQQIDEWWVPEIRRIERLKSSS